jgi:hypothetical protein
VNTELNDKTLTTVAVALTAVVAVAATVIAVGKKNPAPWLTFGGALIVAVIAAITADRRQDRQLDHERDRLRDRLDHERALGDLGEVRGLFERAATAAEDATDAWASLFNIWVWPFPNLRRANSVKAIQHAQNQLRAVGIRFQMFGLRESHRVIIELSEAIDVTDLVAENSFRKKTEIQKAQIQAIARSRSALYKLANRTIGAELPRTHAIRQDQPSEPPGLRAAGAGAGDGRAETVGRKGLHK